MRNPTVGRPGIPDETVKAVFAALDKKKTTLEIAQETGLSDTSISKLRTAWRYARKEKASLTSTEKGPNPHEADAQQQIDATASATPGATADSPEVEK